MEKTDISLLRCYGEKFSHKTVTDNFEKPNAYLKIRFEDYKYKNTYLLTVNIDVDAALNHTEASMSTFTEFIFKYENFVPQIFYAKEIKTMVELVSCAYNNSRIIFYNEYKDIQGLKKLFLPFRFLSEIKEWMATTDVYNQL